MGAEWEAELQVGKAWARGRLGLSRGGDVGGQLAWAPEGKQAAGPVRVALAALKGPPQRSKPPAPPLARLVTARGRALVFRFPGGTGARDAAVAAILAASPAGKEAEARARPFPGLGPPHEAAKRALLGRDAGLAELYEELRGGGKGGDGAAVTEEEFWAAKGEALRTEVARAGVGGTVGQRRGATSAMLVLALQEQVDRAAAEGGSEGAGSVNFSLGEEVRAQILAEKPKVRAAHSAMVPSQASEAEFWGRYCRFVYRQYRAWKGRGGGGVGASGRVPAQSAREVAAAEEDLANERLFGGAGGSRRGVAGAAAGEGASKGNEVGYGEQAGQLAAVERVESRVNLAMDAADRFREGYGLRHDGARESPLAAELGQSKAVLGGYLSSEVNEHAAAVMRTAQAGATPPQASERGRGGSPAHRAGFPRENDDLQQREVPEYAHVDIKDPRAYFGGGDEGPSGSAGVETDAGGADHGVWQEELAALERLGGGGSAHPGVVLGPLSSPEAAFEVLEELQRRVESSRRSEALLQEERGATGSAASVSSEVAKIGRVVNELLRHFWACFPLDEPRRAKADRVRGALGGLYDKLEDLKKGAEGLRRQQISRLVRPQQRAIDAAFDKFRDAAAA